MKDKFIEFISSNKTCVITNVLLMIIIIMDWFV